MLGQILEVLTTRKARLLFTWLILIGTIAHHAIQGWINFEVENRPDHNDGHTSIDFGGQWMMGRLLLLGHGRELYSRERHLEVARESYKQEREAPNATEHDADRLVRWYPGPADDPVGGPLYPPIHAFVMAPIALISDPYWAYRVTQAILMGFVFIAGLGVKYLTRGRWWWSAATAFLLLFPGARGGVDLGQNSPVSIAILIWGWALIVRGRPGWGGFLWGLLAFKPVWAVSFLLALLLLRQWRAAGAMVVTGIGLVLMTIPFVGIHAWFDWLHVGQLATETYLIDHNWIFRSRDLFGIPRRIFLDFEDGHAIENRPIAGIVGWALWGIVFASTVAISWIGRRRVWNDQKVGTLPAFVMLGMWMCAYRFMYYDVLLAAVAVVALFAEPKPFFRRAWWPFASWAAIFVGLLLVIENIAGPLNVEVTASVHGLKGTITNLDHSTKKSAPTLFIASGDDYPWDTLTLMAIWIWCAVRVLRGSDRYLSQSPERSRSSAAPISADRISDSPTNTALTPADSSRLRSA